MSSHSRSHKGKTHGQSRSRSRYRSYSKYEKKYPKQQIMPFKEEKTAILEQVPLTNPNASLYSAGNMPSIVDNNSSNLINMAYVMNQQLVQGSQPFENKPEFVQYAHHHLASANLTLAPNTQFSQELLADKNKKDSSELLMANNLANTNINSSENNLEGSFGHGKIY